MFIIIRLVFVAVFLLPASVSAQDREQLMDEMLQLLEQGGSLASKGIQLNEMVQQFNVVPRTSVRQEVVPVIELDPQFLRTQLAEADVEYVALALCGDIAGLRLCSDAGTYLQYMTAQCTNVFLGTIDLDTYPEVPFALLKDETFKLETSRRDPNFQLFERSEETGRFRYIALMSNVRPDTVAVVLCPEDSNVFGPILRMLPN